jgi:hypothetical protein
MLSYIHFTSSSLPQNGTLQNILYQKWTNLSSADKFHAVKWQGKKWVFCGVNWDYRECFTKSSEKKVGCQEKRLVSV